MTKNAANPPNISEIFSEKMRVIGEAGYSNIDLSMPSAPNFQLPDVAHLFPDEDETAAHASFAGRLTLNEDGFIVLANAIHLSYLHEILTHQRRLSLGHAESDPAYKEAMADRRAASERKDYRDYLDYHLISDERITGRYRVDGEYPPESFGVLHNHWANLIEGDTDIATVRFMDIDFDAEQIRKYGLSPAPYERRRPIAQQDPNDMTRALKKMVIAYFDLIDSKNHEVIETVCFKAPSEKKKGGPYLNQSKAARGKEIGELLSKWEYETKGNPLLKLRKSDFIAVIENSCGFTQTMAASIWDDRPTKGRWSNKGAPKYGSTFISAVEIEDRFCLFKTT